MITEWQTLKGKKGIRTAISCCSEVGISNHARCRDRRSDAKEGWTVRSSIPLPTAAPKQLLSSTDLTR